MDFCAENRGKLWTFVQQLWTFVQQLWTFVQSGTLQLVNYQGFVKE